MKLTILIGCFNEKSTILKAIEQAKAIKVDKEIIVIDNCSTDGTREILESLRNDDELKIVLHSKNLGAGYSGIEGHRLARGEYLYAPGADLEYKMDDVYTLIDKMEKDNLDVVFGSRLKGRKGESTWQSIRERPYWLGTIIGTSLINLLYCRNFTDIIGTNLIKTSILKKLECKAHGQAMAFELASKLCKGGFKIGEVPVWYRPRTLEEGKTIRAFDMVPAILAILKVKIFG